MATLSLRPPDLNQTVASLKKILGDRLIAVVLFGSWARGDAREDSDWDRFVIAQDLPERPFPRHLFFVNQLPPECRAGVSILAKTREEFESLLSSLYLDIALDGKILYDPHGYINEKLTYVRDLLRQKVCGGNASGGISRGDGKSIRASAGLSHGREVNHDTGSCNANFGKKSSIRRYKIQDTGFNR